MKPATIITTTNHNVGDDFVREGILYLLRESGCTLPVELIHKHSPVTAVHGLELVRKLRVSRVLDPIARRLRLENRIDQAEVLIQSGAPIYWCHENGPHCSDNEWFAPLVRKRFLPRRIGRPFLNIAGGSCQRYHSDGSELTSCPACCRYIQEFYDVCDLTLLRDDLARKMLNLAGREARVLPCTSIFARDELNIQPEPGEYIVLNFMENGGHFTFGQNIDGALWRRQFVELAGMAKKMGRVVVACHTPKEEALARELVPFLERYLVPNEHTAYMNFYARAKWGVFNRVHGAFMMASFGRPAALIGNDSRARMIENLNLMSYFVGDVSAVGLENIIESARSRCADYAEESAAIRSSAKGAYLDELRVALKL
jgi:hypothetical protein